MKINKKILGLAGAGLIAAGIFAGCAGGSSQNTTGGNNEKIKVVTTIYPEYDWVKNVAGNSGNVDVELLLKNGIDIHNYSPSVEDMAKISDCDLFIYVGGPSDKWVEGALKNAANKNMKVIKLLDVVADNLKEEETVEGMQDADHDHDHDHEESHGGENANESHNEEKDTTEYDEHVWLSLRNTERFVDEIKNNLVELDSSNADAYSSNAKAYNGELESLDKEYTQAVSSSSLKTILVADRFPFRYMVDDYGLSYYAAFDGCAAETNASFETIAFLSNKVDELNLKHVLKIDGSDGKIAKAVVDNTKNKNQEILELDSMQSVNDDEINGGTTYLSIMKNNLEVLKKALS